MKNKPLDDDQISAIVQAEFEQAMGAPEQEISNERASALDFYLSKEFGNEIDGMSKVVTSDVSDVIDSIMPSLLRLFTSVDNLVQFDAVGPEDVPLAEQESDYVNHCFFKKNPAFEVLYTWFFDALVQKNGIVKAYWDDEEEVTQESYEGLNELELAELMNDPELEPEAERVERQAPTVDLTGQPGVSTVYDIKFKRVKQYGQPRAVNVPPEEYRISADSRSIDPSEARMVGQEREIKRSDLLDMGFKKDLVDKLPAYGERTNRSSEEYSRRERSEERREQDIALDRSQDRIIVKEVYIKLDADGDGRAELMQIFESNGTILSKETVDRQPFHVISPQPLPHKHFGRATAEKVMDIQLLNSTLLRNILDNLYQSNRPSHAVWEDAITEGTIDQLLTTEVGRVVEFSRPVNEAYSPLTLPYTAGDTWPMIQYWDQKTKDRTGIGADSEGLDPEALKNIQTTVMSQAHDVGRMKIEAIARIFAETGLKSLFRHFHELLQKHQNKMEVVQLRNQWVQVSPSAWRTRRDMTVKIGLGIGSREQNLVHLEAVWNKQKDIVAAGGMGTLIQPQDIYNTVYEIAKNANLPNPDMFITNPENMPQQPEQPDEQAELLKAQLKVAQDEVRVQAQRAENQRTADQQKHEREMIKLQQNQEEINNKLLVEMEKISNDLLEIKEKYEPQATG